MHAYLDLWMLILLTTLFDGWGIRLLLSIWAIERKGLEREK